VENLKEALELKLRSARKVALLAVGSDLRADDAAGLLVAAHLEKALRKIRSRRLKVFVGETAPENLTGEIRKFEPTHLVIVDSAEMSQQAGDVRLMKPEETKGITFSTHSLPIKVIADYMTQALGCRVIVIGIQPKILTFSRPVSAPVKSSARKLAAILAKILIPSHRG
jgi:hydrogenase 3 maturation protease